MQLKFLEFIQNKDTYSYRMEQLEDYVRSHNLPDDVEIIISQQHKIESQEAIAEMKIAAEREKNVQSSILEADRTYADILNTVREADERTRTN